MMKMKLDLRKVWRAAIVVVLLAGVGLICVGSTQCSGPPVYTFVKVPASGGAWVDPESPPAVGRAAESAPSASDADVKEILKRLDRIEKLLEQGLKEDKADVPAKEENKSADVWKSAVATCTGCHGSDVATKKGDSFIMFNVTKEDGKTKYTLRDDFSRRELTKMDALVQNGIMPKKSSGKKLTDEQIDAFHNEMKARQEQSK